MNTATKTLLSVFHATVACALWSAPTNSQLAQETSVPEPTQLHTVASADGSELAWSKLLGVINSADANAMISAIEVEGPNGDRVRGVKIALADSTSSDKIYVTDSLLSSLQDELHELEYTRARYGKCQAKGRCVQGIARCRPSETRRQAYCPGHYSTANSEGGFVLSTPRSSFSFPSVEAAQFGTLISEAARVFELNGRGRDE